MRDALTNELLADLPDILPSHQDITAGLKLEDVSEAETWQPTLNLGDFSRALLNAELMDFRVIQLAGASVTLPAGAALIRLLSEIVEGVLERQGYEEFMFPALLAASTLEPARAAFPQVQQLLHASTDADPSSRAILAPTGESAVYTYWAKAVRTSSDLPQRLRHTTTYFRPMGSGTHSGGGPFRSMESPQVHEFHACFADRAEAVAEIGTLLRCEADVANRFRVPALWSLRPPWGNNATLSVRSFGGDALLPSGGTVQIGTAYDQGQIFASAFGVTLRDRDRSAVHQISGSLTRRLVLASLIGGLDPQQDFHIHPEVAPVQIALLSAGSTIATELAAHLRRAGATVRTALSCRGRGELARSERRFHQQGVPVQVLVQEATAAKPLRLVLSGTDEQELYPGSTEEAIDPILQMLRTVAVVGDGQLRDRVRAQVRTATGLTDQARQHVRNGGVLVVPLSFNQEEVRRVESRLGGEVLGFRPGITGGAASIATGAATSVEALISRRT